MLPIAACLAVLGAILLAVAIWFRCRVLPLPRSLVVQYTPARDSSVIGDAILARRDERAAAAALVDLAVRRKVRLIAEPVPGRRGGRATVAVELTDGARLSPAELALLEALFGPGHPRHRVRRFSKDRRAVGRRLRVLVNGVARDHVRRGLIDGDHDDRRVLRTLGTLVVVFASVLLVLALVVGEWTAASAAGVALVIAVAALVIAPRGRIRRFTPAAIPWREHLDGLRQYMTVAEADRIRALQSPSTAELLAVSDDVRSRLGTDAGRFLLHERLVPYAIIFGIEKEWMAQLRLTYAELDRRTLAELGDAIDVTGDLIFLLDAAGDLSHLVFAVGDLTDGAGAVIDVVGGAISAIGDLTP